MKTIELTGNYIVDQVVKKSKARYVEGIKEGDEIKFIMKMKSSRKNYVLYADMYVNGDFHCDISQNEFDKLADIIHLISAN